MDSRVHLEKLGHIAFMSQSACRTGQLVASATGALLQETKGVSASRSMTACCQRHKGAAARDQGSLSKSCHVDHVAVWPFDGTFASVRAAALSIKDGPKEGVH